MQRLERATDRVENAIAGDAIRLWVRNLEIDDIVRHVHQHGVGVCGVYTYEVAETKVAQVVDTARRHQHPLQCTMEKD